MKRFIKYFIMLVLCFASSNVVLAAKQYDVKIELEEDNLIAKCVYSNNNQKDINLYILKDYSIYAAWEGQKFGVENTVTFSTIVDLTYDDFKDEEGNTTCESLKKVYINTDFSYDSSKREGKNISYVEKKAVDRGSAPTSTPYDLNANKSEIYYDNYDKESSITNNWISTCHYDNFYLSFNKETHETNVNTSQDVDKIIADNKYSCPTSLCSTTTCVRGYCATTYTFKNEYDKNCITSMNYTGEYRCGSLSLYMEEYNTISESLKVETNVSDINSLNKIMNQTKSFCNSVMSNLNYSDSNKCVQECLEVIKIMSEEQIQKDGKCGFSKRLLAFITNIVRWIKYIIPVAVIALGMLDFIKSVGADKDDELKKAQGRFVKRLLAAALIFIIPFIIEFVLDKMGFTEYISGCGIIDL